MVIGKTTMNKIAIVDGASYSLPYDVFNILDYHRSDMVEFYCSKTKYNEHYLKYLSKFDNVEIKQYAISNNNKFLGLIQYFLMFIDLFRRAACYKYINFQWSIFIPFEFLFFLFFRDKVVFTFHNETPHNSKRKFSFKNKIISMVCSKIIFVSEVTKDKFISIYGQGVKAKAIVNHHPKIPLLDNDGNVLYCDSDKISKEYRNRLVFWGNVKEYKGLDSLLYLDEYLLQKTKPVVLGKWDKSLSVLKAQLESIGVEIIDKYVDMDELVNYFNNDNLFILPYKKATQSGVLYTLKYYNCNVIASDSGDNARYLRLHGDESNIFGVKDYKHMNLIIAKNMAKQ